MPDQSRRKPKKSESIAALYGSRIKYHPIAELVLDLSRLKEECDGPHLWVDKDVVMQLANLAFAAKIHLDSKVIQASNRMGKPSFVLGGISSELDGLLTEVSKLESVLRS